MKTSVSRTGPHFLVLLGEECRVRMCFVVEKRRHAVLLTKWWSYYKRAEKNPVSVYFDLWSSTVNTDGTLRLYEDEKLVLRSKMAIQGGGSKDSTRWQIEHCWEISGKVQNLQRRSVWTQTGTKFNSSLEDDVPF